MGADQKIEHRIKGTKQNPSQSASQNLTNLSTLSSPPVVGSPSLENSVEQELNISNQKLTELSIQAKTTTATIARPPSTIAEAFSAYIHKLIELAARVLERLRDRALKRPKLRVKISAAARTGTEPQVKTPPQELRELRLDDDSDVNKRRKRALSGWIK